MSCNRNEWVKMKHFKSRNFTTNKELNFYQRNKNTNTLVITIMGHPASDIMKRNQNTNKISLEVK